MMRPPSTQVAVLFVCVALASTGMFAAITLGAVIVAERAGALAASGLPAAVAIVGTALGTALLGSLMQRTSSRVGLQVGWGLAVVGGLVAAVGAQRGSLPLLLAGMAAVGLGNAGSQLARYAAAATVESSRRGSAVAWAVWGATVGAVIGPLALGPAGRLASSAGWSPGLGGFVLVAAAMGAAAIVAFAFRPPAGEASGHDAAPAATAGPEEAVGVRPSLPEAVACLVAAQASMVMVMAITPVHLSSGGHAYGVVGMVMSGHFVGMFAFAPLVGWLVDRMRADRAAQLGLLVLGVGAALAALLPVAHGAALSVPLLLVGVGWCVSFVASSAVVAAAVEGSARKGRIDSLVWICSAGASAVAGVLLAATSYPMVAMIALAVVVAVAALVAPRIVRERNVRAA